MRVRNRVPTLPRSARGPGRLSCPIRPVAHFRSGPLGPVSKSVSIRIIVKSSGTMRHTRGMPKASDLDVTAQSSISIMKVDD